MPRHDCLPPPRTGREDFPHPALTQTLATLQYTGGGRLSSAAQLRSKMRTVPQPCGRGSVGGLSSKRNSHPLIQRVCVPAPSLRGHYPLPRYYEPVRLPTEAVPGVIYSPRALAPDLFGTPPRRVSQVPRLICLRALSPFTPRSPAAAHAHCFTTSARFHPHW